MKEFDDAIVAVDSFLRLKPDDFSAKNLKSEILKRPQVPRKFLPQPLKKRSLVFGVSTNVHFDGTLVEADLTTSSVSISGDEIAGMTREEGDRKVGFRSWDSSQLDELVRQAIAGGEEPQLAGEAPLFISYRWESEEHKRWVGHFADDLVSRGYHVVYDMMVSREHTPPTVPELIARIVKCRVFVPILTEGYRRRVEIHPSECATVIEDGWVFDEWRSALLLCSMDRMKLMGVWRSGPAVPMPFRRSSVADFRDEESYHRMMNMVFPRK